MLYNKPIHLAIVDDQVLFRKTLANFLVEDGNIKVSIHASNVSELLHNLKPTTVPAVDVLLIDIFLPGLNPVDALKSIRCQHPDLKILVMSMNRDLNMISEMLEAGIHGYISKADEPDELLKAIRSVAVNHLFRNILFTEALYFNRIAGWTPRRAAGWMGGLLLFVQSAALAFDANPDSLNRLVDTRLDVRFDYARHLLFGRERVTLTSRGAGTDSLLLDARSMTFRRIALIERGKLTPLRYSYGGSVLRIGLGVKYGPSQTYTVLLDYTANPDAPATPRQRLKIAEVKGLYFINTRGEDGDKPVEIWTQGEPIGSSCWFPTIDYPDQKTREQISMTVPSRYVTHSNGRLVAQRSAGNGLRTDTWRMGKPHSPFLFMMAVGDFRVYQDKWRDKAVNYYPEPKFAPYARQIFGHTPAMIEFYSTVLGVDFPWSKYSQIVVRDYTPAGGMENTTATLLGESMQRTPRELIDVNYDQGESTIAHELFHQWFGDYVTCRTWGDLTVNESFGCLAETLWAEHEYGPDEGAAHMYKTMQEYLSSKNAARKRLRGRNTPMFRTCSMK